jgi:hypothetical protein
LLVACEPIPNMSAAVRQAGAGIEFVYCTETDVDRLLVESREPDGDWTEIAVLEGVEVGPRVPIEIHADPPNAGMPASALLPGSRLNFSVSAGESSGMSEFVVPSTGLPGSAWLRVDGQMADEACP